LAGYVRFDDGKRLFEQLIADGSQGHFAVLTFCDEAIIQGLIGCISFLDRKAAHEQLTANQASIHFSDAHLPSDAGARIVLTQREAHFGNELAIIVHLSEATDKQEQHTGRLAANTRKWA
jgi:hypothetical protein